MPETHKSMPSEGGARVIFSYNEQDQLSFLPFIVMTVYVFTWVGSLLFPFFFLYALFNLNFTLISVLATIWVSSYFFESFERVESWTKFCENYHPRYFRRSSLIIEEDFEQKNGLICVHPHGVFSQGWSFIFENQCVLKNVTACFSDALANTPLFRILARSLKSITGVSKAAIVDLLQKQKMGAMIVGGFEDATIFAYDKDRIFLKNRKGFVKLALQNGTRLFPVYVFGECRSYYNLQGFWDLRLWLNKQGLPGVVPFGWPLIPILPRRDSEIHVVVGKPVVLPKIEKPSREDVAKFHQEYLDALIGLFDRYKVQFYGEEARDRKLEVW